jgi:DNA modification methylase
MNKLFYGDNLDILRNKRFVPDETVDLCYIDPPFNSKRNYNQIYNNIGGEDRAQAQAFVDTWTWDDHANHCFEDILTNKNGVQTAQSIALINGLEKVLGKGALFAYLVSMTVRIAEIHRVLKPTGSFYLHCDPTASHYLKLVCDAIFVSQGGDYKNEIIWRRTGSHNKITRYAPIHDDIFFYTKSSKYCWNKPKRRYMKGHVEDNFVLEDKGYRTNYYGNVLTGSGRRGGESGQEWKGFNPDALGRHWAIPGALLEDIDEDLSSLGQHEKLDRLLELGFIKIIETANLPIYERYIKETDGQPLSDIWAYQPYTEGTVFGTDKGIDDEVRWLSPKDKERLGYPTQKPEELLERIISASSNEGDVVLDAFCGCGTTVAVANRLKRRWIGMDITYQSVALILKRLKDSEGQDAVDAVELLGVPKDMESVDALIHKKDDRVRKEFEKWAILTYSDNRAVINEKKGADKGIDGVAYTRKSKDEVLPVIISVKSGKIGRKEMGELRGTIERENAAAGIMITRHEPTKPMIQEAKEAGQFKPEMYNAFDRLQIVTVQQILDGERMNLPLMEEVTKKAQKAKTEAHPNLFGE